MRSVHIDVKKKIEKERFSGKTPNYLALKHSVYIHLVFEKRPEQSPIVTPNLRGMRKQDCFENFARILRK